MENANRSRNLDLIRWMNGGHNNTASEMSHIANANYVSKMATGEMKISNFDARRIEKSFQLPELWLDRDNLAWIKMDKENYELHKLLLVFPLESKLLLKSFLLSLAADKDLIG